MIPRLGDGNKDDVVFTNMDTDGLENDSPSRGRKRELQQLLSWDTPPSCLENNSPSRGRKLSTTFRYLQLSFRK